MDGVARIPDRRGWRARHRVRWQRRRTRYAPSRWLFPSYRCKAGAPFPGNGAATPHPALASSAPLAGDWGVGEGPLLGPPEARVARQGTSPSGGASPGRCPKRKEGKRGGGKGRMSRSQENSVHKRQGRIPYSWFVALVWKFLALPCMFVWVGRTIGCSPFPIPRG